MAVAGSPWSLNRASRSARSPAALSRSGGKRGLVLEAHGATCRPKVRAHALRRTPLMRRFGPARISVRCRVQRAEQKGDVSC